MRPCENGSRSKANTLLFDDERMTEYTITDCSPHRGRFEPKTDSVRYFIDFETKSEQFDYNFYFLIIKIDDF